MFVLNDQVDIRGVMIDGATILVGVLDGRVCCLHCLLREGEILTRDGIEIGVVLPLHDVS